MKKRFIFFDFDGVIADSFEIGYQLELHLCPNLTREEFSFRFNGNINDWESPMNHHTDDCRHEAIDFWAEFIPKMRDEGKMFTGMEDVIKELETQYTLVIISSSITSPIQEMLDRYHFSGHFDWVMSNEVHQSKVEKIRMAFEKYGIGPEECVFITDTVGDMREAAHMGVPAIGVTWGFQSREMLEQGKYFQIVDEPQDILLAVAERFA